MHFSHSFLRLELVLGRLQVFQLRHYGVCGVGCFSAGEYFAHLSGVELQHAVLGEAKAFVHLSVVSDVRAGAAEDALRVRPVHYGIKRDVVVVVALLIVRHGSQRGRILDHQRVAWKLLILTSAMAELTNNSSSSGRCNYLVVTVGVMVGLLVREVGLLMRGAVATTGGEACGRLARW